MIPVVLLQNILSYTESPIYRIKNSIFKPINPYYLNNNKTGEPKIIFLRHHSGEENIHTISEYIERITYTDSYHNISLVDINMLKFMIVNEFKEKGLHKYLCGLSNTKLNFKLITKEYSKDTLLRNVLHPNLLLGIADTSFLEILLYNTQYIPEKLINKNIINSNIDYEEIKFLINEKLETFIQVEIPLKTVINIMIKIIYKK